MESPTPLTVVCEQCGKSVPAMNSALHLLRCRQTPTPQEAHLSLSDEKDKAVDDSTGINTTLSTSTNSILTTNNSFNSSMTQPSSVEQWACRHCTMLNDFDHKADTPLHCSMCQHFHDLLLVDSWRNCETSTIDNTGREVGDFDEESEDDEVNQEEEHSWINIEDSDNESDLDNDSDSNSISDNDSDGAESLVDLSVWTCSYCTIVNLSREHTCHVCDMLNPMPSSHAHSHLSATAPPPPSALLQSLESTVPTLCYVGLTVGALLTDSTRGPSTRMRNGLIGSVVGTMAGMALSVMMHNPWEDERPGDSSSGSAADRLPVHRYQCCADTTVSTDSSSSSSGSGSTSSDGGRDGDKSTCHICMEEYVQDVEIKTLKCFHMFHAECIDRWLQRKTSCPLCCTDI